MLSMCLILLRGLTMSIVWTCRRHIEVRLFLVSLSGWSVSVEREGRH